MSRPFRDNHRWPGARWVAQIDEALKSIATNDQSRPLPERRVVLAEKEGGECWAKGHIAQNPELVQSIYSAISAANAKDHFPPGVIETALSSADNEREIVQRVVRDAYNHDAAIAQSGTRTPFLLAPKETHFHKLLESVRASSDIEFPADEEALDLEPTAYSELTSEVLGVLRHIDNSHRTKISKFVRSDGHKLLAKWMKGTVQSLARAEAQNVRGEVISRLRAEFDAGELKDGWQDIFAHHQSLIGSLGTSVGIAEALLDELTIYGALGLATGAYGIGHGLAQKLGLASVEYSGPQWAFMYAFGRPASGRRRVRLQQTLDLLVP